MSVLDKKEPESSIREALEYFPAPANLRQSVHAALLREESNMARTERTWDWSWRSIFPLSGAFASGVVATAVAVALYLPARDGNSTDGDVVASHIRSLQVAHLSDVISTDQHTVKPWFAGKLDYSPPVADFSRDGFPLKGARLDYVAGQSVAALVYARQQHVINVYVWPAARPKQSATRRESHEHGFNVLAWQHAGMEYWAVSDLRAEELRIFSDLLISAEPATLQK